MPICDIVQYGISYKCIADNCTSRDCSFIMVPCYYDNRTNNYLLPMENNSKIAKLFFILLKF